MPFVSPDPPVPRSFRASYQHAAIFPLFWSMASFGLNWLFVPVSSFNFTGVVHVDPLLSEYWNMMSVLLLSSGVSWVHIAYRRPACVPLVRSHIRADSASIDRVDWAGM